MQNILQLLGAVAGLILLLLVIGIGDEVGRYIVSRYWWAIILAGLCFWILRKATK